MSAVQAMLYSSHSTTTNTTPTTSAIHLAPTRLTASHLSVNLALRRLYRFSSVTFLPIKLPLIADSAPAHSTPKSRSSSMSANRPLTETHSDANNSTACSLPSMFH
jgi:hypothetical protein